jgi:parallel beta-helix repeat protein
VNAGANAALDNTVVEWAADGVSFMGGGGAVRNSAVRNNKYSGIFIKDASPTIQATTIQNNQFGVRIEQNSSPVLNSGNTISANSYGVYVYGNRVTASNPTPVVTGNSVYDNAQYNYYAYYFRGGNSLTLDGSNNWWGTTDVPTILAKIYDNMDGADYSPTLAFLPFLDAQNGTATNGTAVASTLVTTNTTFATGQTYDVLSALTVQSGSTLTVEEGATVRFFTGSSALTVNGTLVVQGSSANPVRLTSSGSTTKGSWQGVVIGAGSNGSLIENAVIEYAKDGVTFQADSGGTIRNSSVMNSSNAGVYIKDASPTLTGNTLQGNKYGVYVERKSNPLIQDGNVITANTYGVYLKGVNQSGNDPMPVVTHNVLASNTKENLYATSYYNARLVSVTATNNWWGTTDVPTIVSKIYDNIDARTSAPFANFVPFLDGPQGAATTGTVLDVTAPGVPTLAADAVYDVLNSLTVPVGETLFVPAGAKLRFYGIDTELRVNGQLQVQGTSTQPVTLTSGLLSPSKGVWAGVVLAPGTSGSVIQSAVVEWASNGVFFNNAGGELRGSTVRNNLNGVYVYQNAQPLIAGANVITANNIGVNVYGSRAAGLDPVPVITGNSLFGNSPNNLKAYNFYNPASVHIDATGNWWGTTSTTAINAGIYDYSDSATYSPIVDYAPALTAAP